jgi:glycosyltransferase involved in cell wall biosynthesis
MKVFLVNQYAVAPDMPGGTRHFDLSRLSKTYGVEMEIIASDLNLASRTYLRRKVKAKKPVVEVIEGVKFHWLYAECYKTNNWRRMFSMWSFSQEVAKYLDTLEKPDLVIGSSPHLLQAQAACKWAKGKRIPFFLELRDLWPETMIDMTGKEGLGAKYLRCIAKDLYRKSDKIIILARGTEKRLVEYGVSPGKNIYIPNGVAPDAFGVLSEGEKKSIRRSMDLPEDTFIAVYAGAHGRANGLHVVLETARMCRDEKRILFLLIGDGPEKRNLVETAQNQGLTNVVFWDPIKKGEIYKVLAAADVGLLTLIDAEVFRYAISPNKLFDYWGAGLPVLASVPGEIGDIIREAQGGFVVNPEDAQGIAEHLENALNNIEPWRTLGNNGNKYVMEKFNRKKLAKTLADEIKKTVGNKK